jgi:hypothetical protein
MNLLPHLPNDTTLHITDIRDLHIRRPDNPKSHTDLPTVINSSEMCTALLVCRLFDDSVSTAVFSVK